MSDSAMRDVAEQAERDLNSMKQTKGKTSDSTIESGVDTSVENKFAGASVTYGAEATGRTIPPEQGGDQLKSGRITRDRDFEGPGGPEDKERIQADKRGGYDDVPSQNIPRGK